MTAADADATRTDTDAASASEESTGESPASRGSAGESPTGVEPVPRTTRVQELLLGLAAMALVVATVRYVQVGSAPGFETSLVEAFPTQFWLCFYGVLAASVVVSLLAALDASGYWRHAGALALADYALFFFLPLARGYRLYGRGASDILVHVGDVKGILSSGTLAAGSWYPMQHTLVSELVYFGFPLRGAEYVVAFGFSALYVVSMGYLVRTVTDRRETTALGLAAGTPLAFSIFHTTIIPSFLSLLVFPTLVAVIEVYRRSRSIPFLAVFVVFGVGIVFFHPVTAGFLVVLVLSTGAFGYVYEWLTGETVRKVRPTLAVVVAAGAFVWYINFRETRDSIEQVVDAWLSGGSSPGAAVVGEASSVPLSTTDLLVRFLELYGMVFVYLVVAGLFGLVVVYWALRRDGRLRYDEAFATAQFSVGFALAIAFLAVYLIEFEPLRVARYLIVMAVFLYAILLVRATEWRPRRRQLAFVVLGGGVVAAAALGANAAYWPNEQLTDAEYEGSEFVLTNTHGDVPIRTYSIAHKMEWYVRGSLDPEIWPPDFQTTLQRGFGYDRVNTTARQIYGRSYLVTQDFDREFYTDSYFTTEQRRELIPYEPEDIHRLNRDPTVARIYDNGGFEAWYVTGDDNSSG